MSGGNPEKTRLEFANNTPVIDLINALKQGKRFDTPDLQQMSRVKGFAWGTYSFALNCLGDLLVTLHVVLPRGETVNFQAQGRPEQGMSGIAMQMVRHFQRTSLPTESEYDFYRSWATGMAASRWATSSGRWPITTSCRPTPATLLPCATLKRSTARSFLFTACADPRRGTQRALLTARIDLVKETAALLQSERHSSRMVLARLPTCGAGTRLKSAWPTDFNTDRPLLATRKTSARCSLDVPQGL